MVTKYGMSDKLGSVAFEEDIGVVIRGGIARAEKEYSEKLMLKLIAKLWE